MLELRRMDPDDDKHVGVFLLQRAKLIKHVQAVDTAKSPKIEQHNLPAKIGELDLFTARVQPASSAQLRRPHPCHPTMMPHVPRVTFAKGSAPSQLPEPFLGQQ